MVDLKALVVVAAATLGTATSVFAGAGTFTTTVTALTPNITYTPSGAGAAPTILGYQVIVASATSNTNTTNHITFIGTTTVDEPTTEVADFIPGSAEFADPLVPGAPSCSSIPNPAGSPTNARTIRCDIGTLRAGQAYPTFAVFFKAPVKADSAPTNDFVHFKGITQIAEGSPTDFNSVFPWPEVNVKLDADNPVEHVKSAVTKAGGTLFTGVGGVTAGGNPFATTVVIPPALTTYTTAEISIDGGALNCTNFTTCYKSEITIPGTFSPYLKIVLRQDASTIKPGTKIASVQIYYTYTDTTGTHTVPVGACADETTPRNDGIPCLAKPGTYYKSKSAGDLYGDFEWILLNVKNGGYTVL